MSNLRVGEPIVVAFCGKKFHGKDTAASILIEDYGFKQISFADGLRKTVCTALREPLEFFTDPAHKEDIDPRTGKPRRWWLQWIGTEGFRSQWEDVWVSWWQQEILDSDHNRFVSTDLRFPNELAAVRTFLNNMVIRVRNPNRAPAVDEHESERYSDEFIVDEQLNNDSSVTSLRMNCLRAVNAKFRL